MMQLICDGYRADLPNGAGLQFTHTNPLFAFDKMECERTTTIKLPATPNNDRIFGLSRVPAYSGTGMRRRYTAQLQAGAVTIDGYIYISKWTGDGYEAIFVCGDLVELQTIKNAGKIADILNETATAIYGSAAIQPSAAGVWANVIYSAPTGDVIMPSMSLSYIYNNIVQTLGIQAQAFPNSLAGSRIVIAEPNGMTERNTDMQYVSSPMVTDGTYPSCYYNVGIDRPQMYSFNAAKVERVEGAITYTGAVIQLQARQKITLTFPADWDDDYFVGQFLDGGSYLVTEFEFYGGRSFDEDGVVTGESLRGRSVDVEYGKSFVIISKNFYVNENGSGGHRQGWGFSNLECSFTIKGEVEEMGQYIQLQDNLPEITAVELFKTIATLAGCVLNYSPANGLTFEPLDLSQFGVQYIDELTKRGEVMRTFSDYAQRNDIVFKSSGYVPFPLSVSYTIDNVNLEAQKVLQTIPFNEGHSAGGVLYIDNASEQTIAAYSPSTLMRVQLPKNAGLQNLCDMSTQFVIEERMPLFIYNNIKSTTIVQVGGTRYVWTSRQWQKDICKFTLAKV